MIHVLIERHIAEDMMSTYDKLARQSLHTSYMKQGFISGETFTDAENPNRCFLLCKWRSQQDWQRWLNSDERLALISQIAPILIEPERINILTNSPH